MQNNPHPLSPLTYKIVAFAELQYENSDEVIDWAMEMVDLGHDTESLFILAGISKPTTFYEVRRYWKDALRELGLEIKTGEAATLSYASYYVHQIAENKKVRDNLRKLYRFCLCMDYEKLVYDFHKLYWAWGDLECEEYPYNYYWPDANLGNIEGIAIAEAKKWLEKYEDFYNQGIL